ncbi:MAG: 3-dehydroquinate synthase, partial [Dehalococcoidia bacterium]
VAIKARVVSEDERETSGRRAILNYGHTIAHALEAATDYGRLLHGEAVAVGMTAAAEIGRRMGVTPSAVGDRQRAVLERFGLPSRLSGVDLPRVLGAVALDKKVASKAVRWVLLEDIGCTVIRSDVPPSLVEECVAGLLN